MDIASKPSINWLRIAFDVDSVEIEPGVYVLATQTTHNDALLMFVSPAFGAAEELERYCHSNYDDIFTCLYSDD
jgi:hypothetical protein